MNEDLAAKFIHDRTQLRLRCAGDDSLRDEQDIMQIPDERIRKKLEVL